MIPLTGLGIWIWELRACERGDAAAIAAKARRAGVSFVVVKAGEETSNGQVTAGLVNDLRVGGLECAIWWYCRPRSFDSQLAMLKGLQDTAGVRHFVMDAEREWDSPDQRALAGQFAQRLRTTLGPDAFLADAPWARPLSHGSPFPYAAFGAVMDARMPQFYWELAEAEGEAYPHFIEAADAQWAATAADAVICPTLSTVNKDGTKHAPISELALALDRYAARSGVSLWSWQHLSPAEWALLEERAMRPNAIHDPLAGAPVAGLVIPGGNA